MSVGGRFKPGAIITGKWSNKRIRIVSSLGEGANGAVYLVEADGTRAAMKVSAQSSEIALEWGILSTLAGTGNPRFPHPLFADDAVLDVPMYFYVMESIPGDPFARVFPCLDERQRLCALQDILTGLEHLHHTGHAFCDVKSENILVARGASLSVRLVDVGGVTAFGRSIRQFTPLCDRASWGLGSRKSEATYDLAAVALLVIGALQPQVMKVLQEPEMAQRQRGLRKALDSVKPESLRPVLKNMLAGKYRSAAVCLTEIQRVPTSSNAQPTRLTSRQATANKRKRHSGMDWTERMMWASLVTAFSVACIAWVAVFGWL